MSPVSPDKLRITTDTLLALRCSDESNVPDGDSRAHARLNPHRAVGFRRLFLAAAES